MTHPFFVHTTRVCRRVKFFLFPVYVFSLFVKLRHFFSVDVVGICFLLMCARILLSFPKISRTAWSAAIKVCVTQLTVRNSLEGFPRRFFSLSHSLNNFFFSISSQESQNLPFFTLASPSRVLWRPYWLTLLFLSSFTKLLVGG